MFVTEKSFRELKNLEPEVRVMVAKIVNRLLDKSAEVLYGEIYDNGTYHNFTTEQDKNDTHVILAICPSEMGLLEPIEESVAKQEITEEEKEFDKDQRIDDLEKELLHARKLLKATSAKPSGGLSV